MTDFNFDLLFDDVESATEKLVSEINYLRNEVELIETDYDELLKCLGATDLNSALEAISELKAARSRFSAAAPVVKFADSTALTHAELTAILTQSISKAIDDKVKATTPTVRKIRTFRDSAGVN